ncbi:MAG: hypothetical protein V3W06_09170 [Acidimicrobiia bacterium]
MATNISTVGENDSTGTNDTADATGVTLHDTTATFVTDKVQVGETVTNTTSTDTGIITSITDNTHAVMAAGLTGGGDNRWDSGDAYSLPRDYATIGAWELDTDNDLVSAGDIEVAELYDDGADTYFKGSNILAGATTDSSNYRIVRAASGEGHDGTYAGVGVRVWDQVSGTRILTVLEDFCQVGAGMFFELTSGAGQSDECVRFGDSSNDAEGGLVEKALMRNTDTSQDIDAVYGGNHSVGTATNPITVRNCAMTGMTRCGVFAQQYANSASSGDHYWNIINCSIIDCDEGISYGARHSTTTVNLVIVNAIVGDSTTRDYGEGSTTSGTIVTTGSAENWDEQTQIPGAHTDSPMVLLETAGAGGSECLIVSKYGNLKLVDSVDNDVLLDGVGNGSNSLVPTDDFIGNDRGSVSTCDPGCHQVSTPPSAGPRNRAMVVS